MDHTHKNDISKRERRCKSNPQVHVACTEVFIEILFIFSPLFICLSFAWLNI